MRSCVLFLAFLLGGCAHFQGVALPYADGECPHGFSIKGNDSRHALIYHTYQSKYYGKVRAEMCFASGDAARRWGYRPPNLPPAPYRGIPPRR